MSERARIARLGRWIEAGLVFMLAAMNPALVAQEASERGSVEVGFRFLAGNHSSSQFDEYRDLSPGVYIRQFNVDLEHLFDKNYFFTLQTRSSWQNDRRFRGTFGDYAKYRLEFRYDGTPHDFTRSAETLYTQPSPGVFSIPAATRASFQSNPASLPATLAGATPWDIALRRRLAGANFEYTPSARWSVLLGYSRETQNGLRPFGAMLNTTNYALIFPSLEVPEAIDYLTHQAKAGIEFGGTRGAFQLSYGTSVFANQTSDLIFDNPFRSTDVPGQSARGRMALYPDNSAQSLEFAGAYNLSESTRVMASISPEWLHQNAAFLPFTINSAIANVPQLPANSLNGKVQRLSMNYTLASHPLASLSLTAHFRSYDYQNDTQSLLFTDYVETDSSLAGLRRRSLPYGFNRQNAGLEASWLLHPGETLTFGYEFENMDRQHRDVIKSLEHTGLVKLEVNPKKWILMRASYRHSERDPLSYVLNQELNPLGEGPNAAPLPAGWRMYDEAARIRNKADAFLQLDPTDRLSFSASYGTTQDRYNSSLYGLLGYRTLESTADASYLWRKNITLFAEYAYERYLSDQRSRQLLPLVNTPNNDWESYIRDGIHTLGGGVSVAHFRGKIILDAFYNLSIAKGQINTRILGKPSLSNFLVTTAQDYPETSNRFHQATAAIRYPLRKDVTARFEYRWERYDRVDFQIAGMLPYMVPYDPRANSSIYLGDDVPPYQVHILSVSLEYRF